MNNVKKIKINMKKIKEFMNTLKTKVIILLLLGAFPVSQLQAQVTIGSQEAPVTGSVLQLKEKVNVTDNGANAYKGFALPRVTLSDKHQLFPMFLQDCTNAASGPNSYYTANKAILDKTHTGLIVYNLVEDDDKELCLGLNQWDGEQWICFQQKTTSAQFDFDCGKVQAFGEYGDNVALTASNYLRLTLTVTRIGFYTISATSTPDNGYFFETTGTFYSPGTFTLNIPGTGQPVNHTQGADLVNPSDDTPDQFTLTSSGGGTDCGFTVNVRSTAARPEFSIDCAGTVVEGMYFEDKQLSSTPNPYNGQSHRIKVTLKNIPPTSYGATAFLQTNEVDGFSFKGNAILGAPNQDVYLDGTGVPRGLNDKIFTITSNSESSTASCSATVHMLIPRKRLMTLGNTTGPLYGYNAGIVDDRNPKRSLNALLTDKDNFGYNQWSIMKFQGFNNLGTAWDANFIPTSPNSWIDDDRDIIALQTSTWQNMSADKLESLLKGTNGVSKVDIFMIGYDTPFFRGATTVNQDAGDKAKCAKLVDFVKTGGILMICSEATESNGNFLNLLFEITSPTPAISSATGAGSGSLYTLAFNPDNTPATMKPYYCKDNDPILAGPFGDIVGRVWGEDATLTRYITNLPLEQVVVYSGARPIGNTLQPAEAVTVFRHKEYPFIFIGDGGFNSNESRTYAGLTECPFRLTVKTINGHTFNNYPTYKAPYGNASSSACNAIFTANAFAWCIMKAEEYARAHR
jgi:hypothetical protein